jgi:hypothetical protein
MISRLARLRYNPENHSSISIGALFLAPLNPSTFGRESPFLMIVLHLHFFLLCTFRRVEDHMRPLVRSAVQASAATERKARKAATAAASSNKNPNSIRQASRASPPSITRNSSKDHAEDAPLSSARARHDDDDSPKEFVTTSSSAPRRLNDVALAPPELKKLPRGAAKHSSSGGKAKASAAAAAAAAGVLSMAQRAMMEVERENAIRRYREMKERKARVGDRTLLQGEERVDGG